MSHTELPPGEVLLTHDELAAAFDTAFVPRAIGFVAQKRLHVSEADIYDCARRGDIDGLRTLLATPGAVPDINALDRFDGTALYYACLCGHYNCVQLLLASGASCSPHSFEGERCIYGALNDNIRQLLMLYSAANRPRGPLYSYLFNLTGSVTPTPRFSDVAFQLADGTVLRAHRAILAARSPAFFGVHFGIGGRWWGKRLVSLPDPRLHAPSFAAVLGYLYTERLVCRRADIEKVLAIAKNLKIPQLVSFLKAWRPQEAAPVTAPGGAPALGPDAPGPSRARRAAAGVAAEAPTRGTPAGSPPSAAAEADGGASTSPRNGVQRLLRGADPLTVLEAAPQPERIALGAFTALVGGSGGGGDGSGGAAAPSQDARAPPGGGPASADEPADAAEEEEEEDEDEEERAEEAERRRLLEDVAATVAIDLGGPYELGSLPAVPTPEDDATLRAIVSVVTSAHGRYEGSDTADGRGHTASRSRLVDDGYVGRTIKGSRFLLDGLAMDGSDAYADEADDPVLRTLRLYGVRQDMWKHWLHPRGGEGVNGRRGGFEAWDGGDGVLPRGLFSGQRPDDDDDDDDADDDTTSNTTSTPLARAVGHDLVFEVLEEDEEESEEAGSSSKNKKPWVFKAHRVFVCGRCPYFSSMLSFYDKDANTPYVPGEETNEKETAIPRLTIRSIHPIVFGAILEFLYADVLRPLPQALLLPALDAAEALGLPALKPLLVTQALSFIDDDSVLPLFRVGEVYGLQRLSTAAAQYVARRLHVFADSAEFEELVRASGAEIKARQATDSVPVLDEIAYALRNVVYPPPPIDPVRGSGGGLTPAQAAAEAAREAGLCTLREVAARLGYKVML